jgi:hypothetical protein
MTLIFDLPPSPQLANLRKVTATLGAALDAAGAALKAELAAKQAAKKQRDPLDELEEKVMTTTAIAAAASGTPDQAKAMLAKARSKAMQAAADGADTSALEAMVRQMEHLAKIAEENLEAKKRAAGKPPQGDGGAAAIPVIAAIAPPR